MRTRRVALFGSLSLALGSTIALRSMAADPVTIELKDGRVLTGEVDARTDNVALWLRFASPSIVLCHSVAWDQIVGVRAGEQQPSPAEFRHLARRQATDLPQDFFPRRPALPPPPTEEPVAPVNGRLYLLPQVAREPRVTTLHIEAAAANWDADAETDGIELRLLPLSAKGEVIPVDGHLSVAVKARLHRTRRNNESPIQRLESWSQRVKSSDFDTWGAVYRLPAPALDDKQAPTFYTFGLAEAQLYAFPHGQFRADAPVRLRPFNPLGR
jgi:hypothetical protein